MQWFATRRFDRCQNARTPRPTWCGRRCYKWRLGSACAGEGACGGGESGKARLPEPIRSLGAVAARRVNSALLETRGADERHTARMACPSHVSGARRHPSLRQFEPVSDRAHRAATHRIDGENNGCHGSGLPDAMPGSRTASAGNPERFHKARKYSDRIGEGRRASSSRSDRSCATASLWGSDPRTGIRPGSAAGGCAHETGSGDPRSRQTIDQILNSTQPNRAIVTGPP